MEYNWAKPVLFNIILGLKLLSHNMSLQTNFRKFSNLYIFKILIILCIMYTASSLENAGSERCFVINSYN